MPSWNTVANLKGATGDTGGVFGSVLVDFGASDNGGADAMSQVVTVTAPWVTSTSYPIAQVTAGGDHLDADDLTSEEVWATVTNVVIGASFDVEVFAPNGTQGQWLVNWGAALTGENDPNKANITTTISAGDGLSGGGNLSANRSLEVDGTVVRTTRQIISGDGLGGGGDLSANRTLAVDGTVIRSTDARLTTYTPSNTGLIAGPYNRRQFYDDFLYPVATLSANGYVTTVGPIPWYAFVSGTSAIIQYGDFGGDIVNKPFGVWRLSTGTATNGRTTMQCGTMAMPCGLGTLDLYARVAYLSVPTAAQKTSFWFGLSDVAVGLVDGIYIDMFYDAGSSAAVWSGNCVSASALTETAYATTPTISAYSGGSVTFYKLQVSINAAWNSVTFYVNGVQIGSPITTHIPPSLACYPAFGAWKTAGATANSLYIDQFFMDYNYSV